MTPGTDRLTMPQGMAVALLIGAVSWFAVTVTDLYRENGATEQAREDTKRFMDQRNREADDIKASERLLLDHALRNCGCPGGKK